MLFSAVFFFSYCCLLHLISFLYQFCYAMLTFLNYVLFFDIKLCGPLGIEIDSVNPLVALCLAFLNM